MIKLFFLNILIFGIFIQIVINFHAHHMTSGMLHQYDVDDPFYLSCKVLGIFVRQIYSISAGLKMFKCYYVNCQVSQNVQFNIYFEKNFLLFLTILAPLRIPEARKLTNFI